MAEPDAPPAVFFCVQIKLTVGGCEYLEEREYRYSQFKVLHYRLLLVDKIAPDTLAAFPFAAKVVLFPSLRTHRRAGSAVVGLRHALSDCSL